MKEIHTRLKGLAWLTRVGINGKDKTILEAGSCLSGRDITYLKSDGVDMERMIWDLALAQT